MKSLVSQLLRYFCGSCFSGDKGLPSPFPRAWERREASSSLGRGP